MRLFLSYRTSNGEWISIRSCAYILAEHISTDKKTAKKFTQVGHIQSKMPIEARLVDKVGLSLSAKNLPKHTFSVIDPFAVLYLLDKKRETLVGQGFTDTLRDTLNPTWTKIFNVDYLFEEAQEVVVQVYHNSGHADVTQTDRHELVGEYRFALTSLMRAPGLKLTAQLHNARKAGAHLGEVEIRAEQLASTRDIFVADFAGVKLVNKDGFFGTSDPLFDISRMNEDGSYTHVFRSNRIDNNLSPHWGIKRIPMIDLCNGDLDRPLKIEVFDVDSGGKKESMGVVTTSVRGLLQGSGNPMPVIESKSVGKKGYTHSGHLTAKDCVIEYHPSFRDFVMGGLEISLTVGIDFTGSNGDPSDPASLHHIDHSHKSWNVYQQVINGVVNVLQAYDQDQKYPVYGFGARVRQEDGTYTPAQHCFPLAKDGQEVVGLAGIMDVYSRALPDLLLSGPTLIAPLVNLAGHAAAASGCNQEHQRYNILLIITDGSINDMDATKQALLAAAHGPLSVIIIGVGPGDFSEMRALDSDKEPLSFAGQVCVRDIVQFVPFGSGMSAGMLAEQVLGEIPNQVLKYMESNHILPHGKRA